VLAAAEAIGGINLLINAAGVNHFAMLEQLDDSEINAMLALNISAPICLTKLLLPLLKQANSAMVVNVGSTYGSIGYPATPAIAPPSSPCAGFPKRCAGSWRTPGSTCCMSRPAPPAPMNSPAAQALNDALKSNVDDPQTVASAVIHAIAGDRRDLYLGWPERFFVRLNSLLPIWWTEACASNCR
jgi:short-subunit dehydrogenase